MKHWILPLLAFSLGLMGLVTLASVSPELMQRQLVFFFVSFTVFWLVGRVPLDQWWRWGEWLWKALIVILIGLLVFGRVTRGAAAWLDIGWGLRFQPSQFALMVTLLAALPQYAQRKLLKESELFRLLILLGLPALLILLQPDFGTVFVYFLSVSPLFFLQKIPSKYWRILGVSVLVVGVLGWTLVLQPYQKLRITSFLAGSQADQSGAGYNARQALIAVGSGQLLGKGLGQGTQSHLRFLPERQTDFIFASLAEEWGLMGSLIIIALYAALILFLLSQAARMKDPRHALFLSVVAVFFLAQTFINIGMNIGLLPITGITLPLVSYGGSSLLATLLLLGVTQRIISHSR